jgi:hypothetical protein
LKAFFDAFSTTDSDTSDDFYGPALTMWDYPENHIHVTTNLGRKFVDWDQTELETLPREENDDYKNWEGRSLWRSVDLKESYCTEADLEVAGVDVEIGVRVKVPKGR